MKVKTLHIAMIIFIIIFGGIALTSVLGLWNTVNTKEPARYASGEFAGEYNPADIRGSYTFGEISELFGIPLEDLGKAFAVKDESKYEAFQCKELEAIYAASSAEGKEVGTDSVRIFVSLYKSLPITLNNATYLPKPAVSILKSKAKLIDEQLTYLESHTVTPLDTEPAAVNSGTENTDGIIKGSTTFKVLLDWGVKKEDIENIINDKMPDTSRTVKDYATAKGVEFSTLKEPLQELVDKLKN